MNDFEETIRWDVVFSAPKEPETHPVKCECCPNPVVKTTALRAYPGWTVREYANGIFDATDNVGLTMGFNSFLEAVAAVKAETR